MIQSKLFGQLGNQLFMISAAVSHALKMNTNYAFPEKTTAPRIWRTYLHHLPKTRPNQATRDYFKHLDPEYKPLPESDDLTLEGYFQSEKYWHDKVKLAEILQFKYTPADYVAIHVRRGDYLKYPDQFPVLKLDYYLEAINKILSLGEQRLRVYSDDINWCKNAFNKMGYQFEYSENKAPLDDMRDMYNAKVIIAANSTFSLFPALLRADDPLVIAPAEHRWFGPKAQNLNSPDRMPDRFIKL